MQVDFLKQISSHFDSGRIQQVLLLTKNSYDQIQRSPANIEVIAENETDQTLALIYLAVKFLKMAFEKDCKHTEAIEIKLKLLSRYP